MDAVLHSDSVQSSYEVERARPEDPQIGQFHVFFLFFCVFSRLDGFFLLRRMHFADVLQGLCSPSEQASPARLEDSRRLLSRAHRLPGGEAEGSGRFLTVFYIRF